MHCNAKKTFHLVSILLLVCAMVNLLIYLRHGSLLCKGITSTWFFLQGCVSLIYAKISEGKAYRYMVCMVLGLLSGVCADVLLGLRFLVGVVAFAIGHIMYLIAFHILEAFRKPDLWCILPFAVFSGYMVLFSPFIRLDDPSMKIILVGYALIISAMVGKAISNFLVQKSLSGLLVLVGAIMFWFSDFVLAVNIFGTGFSGDSILCGITYWPGQNLLAYSLFHHVSAKITK
jgi:uncharacterized membrane protein YhhN